ncbi:hypothetical protein ACL02R_22635, partial [Streptomyces sp. MS19]|uniref:hypothetical protein n=1 Tax=Streptomyces sp. MS19 TaxID=3385972 RepID=UPI0039A3CE79
MGISDQFKDKAKELQNRAKEAMDERNDDRSRGGDQGDGNKRDDMVKRGKEQGRKAADRAKQMRDERRDDG